MTRNEERARLRDLEAEVERLRKSFAHTSHEMRTYLNGVIGMTALLRTSPLSSEQQEYADAIWHCAQQLLAIINDMSPSQASKDEP